MILSIQNMGTNLTLLYIITTNALATIQDPLPSLKMFLASAFPALCSLLTLLGTAEASAVSPPSSSLPSSTLPGPSSTLPPLSSGPVVAPSGFSRLGDVLKPTVTPYTFVPFPAPSETSIPSVFPETWPNNPPPAGDSAIPDFGPAWDDAYSKARKMVREFCHCFCFPAESHRVRKHRRSLA